MAKDNGATDLFGSDPSEINPFGAEQSDVQSYRDALQDSIKALQDRYAQPNWFKVAAGFAKPQLGGFTASLGSAAGALGDWQDQQRAAELPIAQMRAKLAQTNILMGQKQKAADLAEEIAKNGGIPSPNAAFKMAALTKGPTEAIAGSQAVSDSQANQFLSALKAGDTTAQLEAKFGKPYVDSHIGRFLPQASSSPSAVNTVGQNITGTPTTGVSQPEPNATTGSNQAAVAGTNIPGIPPSLMGGMTLDQALSTQSKAISDRMDRVNNLKKSLSDQAANATPIFEVANNLYSIASKDSLKPAFGVFEKGDVGSMIGRALETQTLSNVLAQMREGITQAKLNPDQRNHAMSDFQTMENLLGDLQTKVQNGIINPTDVRTMLEAGSVPGSKNTQDSFLRGVARIGSDALNKYENKIALDTFLNKKNADIYDWETSDEFKKTQANAQKRNHSLISNPASAELPQFFQRGLEGAYHPTSAPTSTSSASKKWEDEARKRGLIK